MYQSLLSCCGMNRQRASKPVVTNQQVAKAQPGWNDDVKDPTRSSRPILPPQHMQHTQLIQHSHAGMCLQKGGSSAGPSASSG